MRSRDIRDQSRKFAYIAPTFGRFFALQNFKKAMPPKIVPTLTPQLKGTSSGKVTGATPTTAKVIGAGMLNFKPILDPSLKKNCKGNTSSRWGCASKTWSFSIARQNVGAQHPPRGRNIVFRKS